MYGIDDDDDNNDLILDEETGEYIHIYDTLSYDQQYRYLCEVRGEKLCQRCNSWESVLHDGLCYCCQDFLESLRHAENG